MLLQLSHHPAVQTCTACLGSFISYRPDYPILDGHQLLVPVTFMAWVILFFAWNNMFQTLEPSESEGGRR